MILYMLIVMIAGWMQRHQQQIIMSLQEENRVLKAQFGGRRLRLTDTERCSLAALARPLGRKHLKERATIATPDTSLRWYKRLIAQKFDGSKQRRQGGRPRVAEEIEQLHDRDATFTLAFDGILKGCGVAPIVLPPRSPNLHAHCERFVRSIKEEALDHMVMLGERCFHQVIHQYLTHSHTERNHQGLGHVRIAPAPATEGESGRVVCRDRLGGLLSYYRDAA
jgi:hypothetical protein